MHIDRYQEFLAAREKLGDFAPYAPYHWCCLAKTIPIEWAAYSQFLQEHASELSNSINELRRYLGSLMAWQNVINQLEEDELHRTVIEFITPIATLAVLMPYVIRSRLIYSIAHLSHQANRLKLDNWSDDLPIDTEIYLKEADKYGGSWRSYPKLKVALEKISNKQYSKATHDFRNSFNHRYSPRIELGLTGLVTRFVSDDGNVSYGFGQTPPLKLSEITSLILNQHKHCMRTYEKYQALVNEQSEAINKHITSYSTRTPDPSLRSGSGTCE